MAERGGLENRCTLAGTVSSNLTLSANSRTERCVGRAARQLQGIGNLGTHLDSSRNLKTNAADWEET